MRKARVLHQLRRLPHSQLRLPRLLRPLLLPLQARAARLLHLRGQAAARLTAPTRLPLQLRPHRCAPRLRSY